jgi:hypothetical protein
MTLGNIHIHDFSSVFVPYTVDDCHNATNYWFMTNQGATIKERICTDHSGCVVDSYSLYSTVTTNCVFMDV